MQLLANWRNILTRAWSFRLIVLSGLLSGAEVALPIFQQSMEPLQIIPPGAFAVAAILTSAAAAVARVVAQPVTMPAGRSGP